MPYGGNPHTTPSDAVRVLVGDTNASAPLLDDNTYTFILAQEPNVYARAALACDALAGKYALQMDKRIGDLWRSAKVQHDHYANLAHMYREEAARRGKPVPFGGGVSVTDYDNRNEETDRVKPRFEVGMLDAIGTSKPQLSDPSNDG